jgi:hypothetical protein
MNQADLDQALTSVINRATSRGLKSFVLLIPTLDDAHPGQYQATVRFNEINPQLALNLTIHAFSEAIKLEIERHPEYDPAYKQLFLDMRTDFEAMVKLYTGKLKKFKQK